MAQYAVIGLGKFGTKVARTLAEEDAEVIAIDSDPKRVEEIKDLIAEAICMDSTDEETMQTVGVENVQAAVVAIGDDQEASILSTAVLKHLGVPQIFARATSDLHGRILELVGANRVILIEDMMGEQIAKSLVAPNVLDRIELSTGYTMAEVSSDDIFAGKTLRELNVREAFALNVIAIKRRVPVVPDSGESAFEERVNNLPGPDDRIEPGDVLVIVGTTESVERLDRRMRR